MTKKLEEVPVFRVPFRSIYIPASQIRSDEPEIQRIAASLEQNGQLYPVLVTEGGPDGKDYTLNEGFRRAAAFVLNSWQNKDILVRVVEKKDPFSRIATNFVANMEREGLNFVDQCECVASLVEGNYPVNPGEEAAPIDRGEVAQRLGISVGQVGRMLRVKKNLDGDVASLARKSGAPSYLLLEIAKIDGEGDDTNAKQEDRATKQSALLTSWIEKQRQLKEMGRQRAERSDKGKKNGKRSKVSDEPQGVVNPTKKVAHAVYKNESERAYTVEDYVTVLQRKASAIVREKKAVRDLSPKEQGIRLSGILDGLRFMKGEITRLPDLTKEDFDFLKPPPVEVSADAEE